MTIGDENFMRAQATPTDEDREPFQWDDPVEPCDRCNGEDGTMGLGQFMLCRPCWDAAGRAGIRVNISAAGNARALRRTARTMQRYAPPAGSSWRSWFADGAYLGEVSARTGPDAVETKQRCACEVCKDGRDG